MGSIDRLSSVQATSALAGLLEEDAVATSESKVIDNAWRGAEVRTVGILRNHNPTSNRDVTRHH